MIVRELNDDEVRRVMREAELPDDLRRAASRVAAVFTQDWCPDWFVVQRMLRKLAERGTSTDTGRAVVYTFAYNKSDLFQEFRRFKEDGWGSYLIPYIRYYRDGQLVAETNRVRESRFASLLGLDHCTESGGASGSQDG